MKKLLSLLTISGVIASSSTVISCSKNNDNKRVLADATKIELGTSFATNNAQLYTSVRKQIGSYATPIANADDIKKDENCLISIWLDDVNTMPDDNTPISSEEWYNVHITVQTGDTYFEPANIFTLKVHVIVEAPTKININDLILNQRSTAKTGDVLFTEVYTSIAKLLITPTNSITAQQMRTDDTLQITINNVTDSINSKLNTNTIYDVNINVLNDNIWFEVTSSPFYTTTKTATTNGKAILTTIDPIFTTTPTGEEIFKEIYDVLSKITSVSSNEIRNSSGIKIEGWDSKGRILKDNNDSLPYGKGWFRVTIDSTNEYLEPTSTPIETDFSIQYDSNEIKFSGGEQANINTGTALLMNIELQLNNMIAAPNNTIANDDNITITMYKNDEITIVPADDTATTVDTYKIKIVIIAGDNWFNEYDGATKFDFNLT